MMGLESSAKSDMLATSLKNAMPMLTSVISAAQVAAKSPQNNDEERDKEIASKKLALYEKAMSFGENSIVFYQRAISEMDLEDNDSAISDLKKAIKLYPTYDDAYRGLSRAFARINDLDESRKYLQMAVKLGENSEKATNNLLLAEASAKLVAKNYPQVIEAANKIIAIDSKNTKAYLLRGIAWVFLEQYDQAIPDLSRCIELQPDILAAYTNLSFIYQKRGDLKKSLDYITEGLKYHPEDGEAHYRRGFIIFLMGDKKKADEEGKIACDLGYKKGCD
jgi:tetratricopeptide (TPR) repeat protein